VWDGEGDAAVDEGDGAGALEAGAVEVGDAAACVGVAAAAGLGDWAEADTCVPISTAAAAS
jgi:hypothetical protein